MSKPREPQVTRTGALTMQVCVPAEMTDAEVEAFANRANMSGTENGWKIRKQGDPSLQGENERVDCRGGGDDRKDCVHIMLDC